MNYDYKNSIEEFAAKKNNPLNFPDKLLIDIEKVVPSHHLSFEEKMAQYQKIIIKPLITKEQYIEKVKTLIDHIKWGNIYEINFCMTFEAKDAEIDPVTLFQKLNTISQASYAALAKFNHLYIISSSPELFLSKRQNNLFTKPIKGTAKRGKTSDEDLRFIHQLKNSLKERTENVMIVDVARNDLSRIAKKGTVTVDKLFDIESYQQVHQMVSTVSCQLKENISFDKIIDASFPMASMTGAPKIKAMQLIDEFETYNRNAYSGSLGYISENGDFDLNVLIRSIFYDQEKKYLSFSVGSAITAMCNPEEEYEECLLKAKAMFQVLNS